MVVASLECFYKHNAEANSKKNKRDEINKHSRTGARMRATIFERQTSGRRDPTLSQMLSLPRECEVPDLTAFADVKLNRWLNLPVQL
jgi:hypothetical protein